MSNVRVLVLPASQRKQVSRYTIGSTLQSACTVRDAKVSWKRC